MNAAAWIALATLALLFVAQAVSFAFVLGGLFQRVKALELNGNGIDCATALASMDATMKALGDRIGSLEQMVRDLLMQPNHGRRGAQ